MAEHRLGASSWLRGGRWRKPPVENPMSRRKRTARFAVNTIAAAVRVAPARLVALAEGAPRGDDARDLRQHGAPEEDHQQRPLHLKQASAPRKRA